MKTIRTIKVGPNAPDINSLWLYKNTAKYFNNGKWTEIKEEEKELEPIKWEDIQDKPVLSKVANTGKYSDLIDTPTPYTLPSATTTKLGGVKMGSNVADLTAEATLEQVIQEYNSLLEVLRTAGIISK